MRSAVSENSASDIARSAHTLKSSAGQLGARRLAEISKNVEAVAKRVMDERGAISGPHRAELDDALSRALLALEATSEGLRRSGPTKH